VDFTGADCKGVIWYKAIYDSTTVFPDFKDDMILKD